LPPGFILSQKTILRNAHPNPSKPKSGVVCVQDAVFDEKGDEADNLGYDEVLKKT